MTLPNLCCPVCKSSIPPLEPEQKVVICARCGKELNAYEMGMVEVRAYIRQVNLIEAIKIYKKLTGVDLKTAIDTVGEMWHNGDW